MTLACRTHFALHRPILFNVRKCSSSVSTVALPTGLKEEGQGKRDGEKKTNRDWKQLDATELGITNSMISNPTRVVLKGLKKKGYEVYLVGGCVRDLILKRIPKDFDVITSAELKEVRNTFRHCEIVGRRFPICHVHVDDTVIEVSSFSTSVKKNSAKFSHDFRKPPGCNERDYIRWKNCIQRDFTINGLMFDPYANLVYDYVGGMEDIRKTKVRTVIPANISFMEDCARILRACRVAARLGFQFTKEVAILLKKSSDSVQRLDKGRILLELNYMLAYGSAEASLRLLWRFGLLEILLPIQASYFVSQGFRRRDKRSNMLLSLLSNLDRLVAPDRPCHTSLWISIFVFHKALVDKPQDPSVIAAFSLAVHSGGSLFESIEIARNISQPPVSGFPEVRAHDVNSNDAMMKEVIDLAASVNKTLNNMTDGYYVSQAMSKYPQAPHSDLVFISLQLSFRVSKIFECVRKGMEKGIVPKRRKKLDCQSLADGRLPDIRHAFARIVFDTIYPLARNNSKLCEQHDMHFPS